MKKDILVLKEYRIQPLWIKIVILFFVSCLLGATKNHLDDVINYGMFPYTELWGAPLILNIYWTILTIVDPICAVLLLISTKKGLVILNIVMISNIAINWFATYQYWDLTVLTNQSLQLQLTFGVCVFILSPIILRKLNRKEG